MPFLALDQFARIKPVWLNIGPLFLSALHALAVDDASDGAGLSFRFLAAFGGAAQFPVA
jgi:hypothetical protein